MFPSTWFELIFKYHIRKETAKLRKNIAKKVFRSLEKVFAFITKKLTRVLPISPDIKVQLQ